MKKFAIALIALATVSTAAFAGANRSNDLRDTEAYMGKYAVQMSGEAADSNALVVMSTKAPASNFERLIWTSWANDQGGRH
jgi:16S rRNA G1207 methylase RsmC